MGCLGGRSSKEKRSASPEIPAEKGPSLLLERREDENHVLICNMDNSGGNSYNLIYDKNLRDWTCLCYKEKQQEIWGMSTISGAKR